MSRELTVAALLAELERIGADPTTTTFEVSGDGQVSDADGDCVVERRDGSVVVTFLGGDGCCGCE